MIESKAIDDGLKFRNQIDAEAQCKKGEVMRSEFDTLEQYQESMKEFNENTRMGFEEFIQSHGSDRNKLQLRCTPYTSKKGGYGSFDLDFGLCVYQHQQTKVDELKLQVAEMKSRLNDAYTDGQSAMYTARQSKIDELQKQNAWLSGVAERENKRANNLQQDALSRMESCYIEQKKHVELLQTEVTRLNSTVERLKAENKMLHEAAATHLRNQNHFMDLYNRLIEQLYPYAIDLEDPVVGNAKTTPQEFIDGYNRARECAHYNLLEMMESDEEYIRAQCGMLGGGGGSDESN